MFRFPRSLAEFALYISLAGIFLFLILARPPASFYALPLAPIALAALLYEFVGGTVVALISVIGIGALIALDPDAARRGEILLEVWPILLAYLAAGPAVGWLAGRERELETKRARQLAAISAAGREIASTLNLDHMLGLVMTKAVETLPMDAGAILQVEPESQTYRVAVSHNISSRHADEISFALNEGVPGWVVDHRRALAIPNALADKRVHPAVVEDGVQSVLALPLVARDRVVGVLNLYSKSKQDAFDREAVQLARVYADQAAIAIENAHLVNELRKGAAELEARVEERTRKLQETQRQVIRSEKLAGVGRLAASVAHEVNNPLQAITLQLQLIADESLPPEILGRLTIVQQEIDRIAGIVQRLLDFQKPTPGVRQLHSISDLLGDVLALSDKQLQQQNIEIRREDYERMPALALNGGQIKQVFLNLVLNAIDAMPEGGELRIRTTVENDDVIVSFTDTGTGIPHEDLELLFEPFFSTKPDGNGLGLAVSHEIVTGHGGCLEVESELHRGSTFHVILPVELGREAIIFRE